MDRRNAVDPDFPPLSTDTNITSLTYSNAAEMMFHFRNYWDNYQRGIIALGDPSWKEIDECYFPPNPNITSFDTMTPIEYIGNVITVSNNALASTPFEVTCVQNEISERPETTDFLAQHFMLELPSVAEQAVT